MYDSVVSFTPFAAVSTPRKKEPAMAATGST